MTAAGSGPLRAWLLRRRLDVPEVHDMIAAEARMLDGWAETEPDSRERADLWMAVHRAGDALADAAYGGPTVATRLSYWLRPYDSRIDDRCWRWQRPGPCRVLACPDANDRSDRPGGGS